MPAGIPVATVALNGSRNAGILAAQIIATGNSEIMERVKVFKSELAQKVISANVELAKIQFEYRTNGK
jgi:5-(carboxyamino)imidazole ribonucleotide mutase